MLKYFILLFFGISTICSHGSQIVDISLYTQNQILNSPEFGLTYPSDQPPRFEKGKVILLTVLLGHFGVHRIYLGTEPNVPVVYSLTLGGGLGLLPLVDLIAILTTKDLDRFKNNNKVFMWTKPLK